MTETTTTPEAEVTAPAAPKAKKTVRPVSDLAANSDNAPSGGRVETDDEPVQGATDGDPISEEAYTLPSGLEITVQRF